MVIYADVIVKNMNLRKNTKINNKPLIKTI